MLWLRAGASSPEKHGGLAEQKADVVEVVVLPIAILISFVILGA
jgi:hypothetical protein